MTTVAFIHKHMKASLLSQHVYHSLATPQPVMVSVSLTWTVSGKCSQCCQVQVLQTL